MANEPVILNVYDMVRIFPRCLTSLCYLAVACLVLHFSYDRIPSLPQTECRNTRRVACLTVVSRLLAYWPPMSLTCQILFILSVK